VLQPENHLGMLLEDLDRARVIILAANHEKDAAFGEREEMPLNSLEGFTAR